MNESKFRLSRPAGAALLALVTACSLTPELEQPEVAVPAAYKEAAPDLPAEERGTWKVAEPSEEIARGEWWKVFNDPVLDALEAEAMTTNQNLQIAAARVKQVRALLGVTRADQYPQFTAGFGPSRIQATGVSLGFPDGTRIPPYTAWRALITASYEVDLFGRVASSVAAARNDLASSEATYRSVTLALQADVAQTYFLLREADAEIVLLRETVDWRAQSVKLQQRRFDLGDISELDLAQAKTELATTRADLIVSERARARFEHALAVLIGRPPAAFDFDSSPLTAGVPAIPAGLPSSLLERRPDIAAAVKQMAASNERIGVARAAFFPRLSLTAFGGYESSDLGNLFNWSQRTWALGPLIGTMLTTPIFTGGRNQANLDRSWAVLEESVAVYRQQVLTAFQEVEDNLSGLRTLAAQDEAVQDAVVSATRAVKIADTRYRAGATNYLDVIDTQRRLLAVQVQERQIRGARATSTVALIRALGGGWDVPETVSMQEQ